MTRRSLNGAFESRARRDPGVCPLGFDPWGSLGLSIQSSRHTPRTSIHRAGRLPSVTRRRRLAPAKVRTRSGTDRLLAAAEEIREHRGHPPWCLRGWARSSRPCRPFNECRSVMAHPRVPTQGNPHARCGSSPQGIDHPARASPRRDALHPDSDRVSYSRGELDGKIKVSLGSRAAEEVVFGEITTGAESDRHVGSERRTAAAASRRERNLGPDPTTDRR